MARNSQRRDVGLRRLPGCLLDQPASDAKPAGLGRRAPCCIHFVVVGLDPGQDKPADWADFRTERKRRRPTWHILCGDEASTRAVANLLGVRLRRYGEHMMHDFTIVLLSPQGQTLRSIDRFDEAVATLLP